MKNTEKKNVEKKSSTAVKVFAFVLAGIMAFATVATVLAVLLG